MPPLNPTTAVPPAPPAAAPLPWRTIAGAAGWRLPAWFGAGYLAVAELGRCFTPAGAPPAGAWLPAGLLVAALMLGEQRLWPRLFLAAATAHLIHFLVSGLPPLVALGSFAGGVVQALTGAWLVRRGGTRRPGVTPLCEYLGLLGCTALLAPVPVALATAAAAWPQGAGAAWSGAAYRWLESALAVLLLLPFVVAWFGSEQPVRKARGDGRRLLEAGLLAGLTAVLSWHLLGATRGHSTPGPWLLLLPLVLVGVRFGLRGAATANLLFASWLAYLTTQHQFGLAAADVAAGFPLVALYSFAGVAALVTLVPALAIEERDRSLARLAETEERYRHLTVAAFEGVFVFEDGRIVDANEQAQALTGYSRAELMGRPGASLVAPEAVAEARAVVAASRESAYELPLLHRDGRRIDVEVRGRTLHLGPRTVRLTAMRDITEHRRMKRALEDSERRFRGLLDHLPIAAFTCDAGGRITYFNHQAHRLWDRTPELGSPQELFCGSLELLSADGTPVPHDQCWMAVALAERRPVLGRRIVIARPDGSRRTVLAHASPLFDAAGELAGAINALTDLTELTRAREALAASEDRFRAAMHYSPVGMALLAPHGAILEVNPALCQLLGYTREEMLARNFRDLTHPDDIAEGANLVQRLLERKIEHYQREARGLHRDGRSLWLQVNVSLVLNADGSPRHLVSQVQDVTGRRTAEQALRDYQGKLVLALELARLGQWEFDVAGGWFTFDDNFLRLLGTSAAREGGRRMRADDYARRFIPPGEAGLVAAEVQRAIAAPDAGYTRQLEHRFRRADGSAGVMSVRIAIEKDAAGRTVRTYGVNQDITERRAAEEKQQLLEAQLLQAQKMEAIGTLAGGIAHDFNNILTGIMGNLELAGQDLSPGHPATCAVQEAHQASRRARDLVARILAFSRRGRNARAAHALGPVVQEAVHLLRASLPSTIEIRTSLAADCPPVHCDPGQIHQSIMNLGTNAAHAMRADGGLLTVSLQRVEPGAELRGHHPQVLADHTVLLSVRDTGCGMSEAVRQRIFEPFFTTKQAGEGTGLGLAIVHGIVEDHGGAIVVDSRPGGGTTFDLYLRAAERPAGGAAPVAPLDRLRPFGRRRQVLVVDDEESVLRVAALMLERLGFTPRTFAEPAAALAAFRAAPAEVAAVISDLTMPSMTGLELARLLQAVRRDLPLLLASGHLHGEAWIEAGALGLRHFVDKPFELQALAAQLRHALGEPPGAFAAPGFFTDAAGGAHPS